MKNRTFLPMSVALLIGAGLWFAAAALSGRREPWDASAYWAVAYPASILAAAILGYLFPLRAWRWGFALFAGQFIGMCVRDGELGNLWPLGLAMFAVLALPAAGAAAGLARLNPQRSG